MDIVQFLSENYEWQLALIGFVAVIALPILATRFVLLVPVFREIHELNKEVLDQQVAKSFYEPIRDRSKFWGLLTQVAVFVFILPFCLTLEPQPWWKMLLDMFIILMFYDFFYYLVHRFLFHDGGFGPGPLMWVHAVHHQQKDPCRGDSAYLHPLETSMGIALYGASIGALGAMLGDFHLVTIIVTWIAFSEINLHNHDRMKADHFPYKYLKYMSFMHHVHHARFTAGNYATISLFYDWLFGTYDTGDGWGKNRRTAA